MIVEDIFSRNEVIVNVSIAQLVIGDHRDIETKRGKEKETNKRRHTCLKLAIGLYSNIVRFDDGRQLQ